MFSKIALESLTQRGRSALYTSLVAVYQKAQDALHGLKNPTDKQIIKVLKSLSFTAEIAKALSSTNIPIKEVVLAEMPEVNLMCAMYTNDLYRYKSRFKKTSPGTVMEELNRLYDDRAGKFVEAIDEKDSPFYFRVFIYTGLFKMRNNSDQFELTAEELTAGTLHEIGHADHFIRIWLRAQERLVDASDIIDYLETTHDKQTILEVIAILLKDKRTVAKWGKSLLILQKEVKASNDDNDPRRFEFISVLATIMTENVSSWQLTLLGTAFGYTRQRKNSTLFGVDSERSADEYSARHGAYSPLVSFLAKIDRFQGPDFAKYHAAMTGSKASAVIRILAKFDEKMNTSAEEITDGYDPLIKRLELIVETAKHAFHDDKLPKSVIEGLKKDIAEAEAYLNNYRYADYRNSRLRMAQWRDNIAKFGRIVKSPFSDRLRERYSHIQDANRTLSRHPLYWLAKK